MQEVVRGVFMADFIVITDSTAAGTSMAGIGSGTSI
jgi:hypothetical protein